ncbi:MAG TPA: GDSL-type esterase/lipase family protein [Glaciibacter sp.]|nr:GDSL-type esterase/lipase family protein [Glaciibacter sp.]
MTDQPRAKASTHATQEPTIRSTTKRRPRRLATLAALGVLAVAGASGLTAAPAVAAAGDEHLAGLNYVALGDSYTSGFGLADITDLPVEGCFQAAGNFPHLVAANLGLDLHDASCSGAKTEHILNTPHDTGFDEAPPQSSALSADTDIVTVAIGGNDLGFSDVLAACTALSPVGPLAGAQTIPNCQSIFNPAPSTDVLAQKLAGLVEPAIAATFADITAKAPDAKIFVLGYPTLFPDAANTPASGCFTSAFGTGAPPFPTNAYPFTNVDVPYLHSIELALDAAVARQAAAIGATFVENGQETLDNTPCAAADQAQINGISVTSFTPGSPPIVETAVGAMHPNDAGVAFLRSKVESAIRAAFPAPVVVPMPAPAAAAPVTALPELAATGTEPGSWLALAGIFVALGGGLLVKRRFARR